MRLPEASNVASDAWFEFRISQDIDHRSTLVELRPKFNDNFVRIAAGRDCTAKNAGNICHVANTSGLPQLVTAKGLGSGATFQKRTLPPPRLARQNSHAFAS